MLRNITTCFIFAVSKSNDMRKAINVTETRLQQTGLGRIDKKEMVSFRMVAIDNYGQTTLSSFLNRLIEKGRLPYEFKKKLSHSFTNEFLTDLLNKNEDLFEVQF